MGQTTHDQYASLAPRDCRGLGGGGILRVWRKSAALVGILAPEHRPVSQAGTITPVGECLGFHGSLRGSLRAFLAGGDGAYARGRRALRQGGRHGRGESGFNLGSDPRDALKPLHSV